jgi:hypothetical protein
LLGLLAPHRAEAQGIEPGDRVVLASIDDVLKIEARIVASGAVHRVYTVGKVNGPWLWLEAEDLAGWIKGDRVLPFDQALERASDRIASGNASANDYLTRGLLRADRGRPRPTSTRPSGSNPNGGPPGSTAATSAGPPGGPTRPSTT